MCSYDDQAQSASTEDASVEALCHHFLDIIFSYIHRIFGKVYLYIYMYILYLFRIYIIYSVFNLHIVYTNIYRYIYIYIHIHIYIEYTKIGNVYIDRIYMYFRVYINRKCIYR